MGLGGAAERFPSGEQTDLAGGEGIKLLSDGLELCHYLRDGEQAHQHVQLGQAAIQLPGAEGQAGRAGNGVHAHHGQQHADDGGDEALDHILGAKAHHDGQAHQAHGEVLPRAELQGDLGQLRRDDHQGQGADEAADEGGEHAQGQGLSRPSVAGHG